MQKRKTGDRSLGGFCEIFAFFFSKILYKSMLTFVANPKKDEIYTNLKN